MAKFSDNSKTLLSRKFTAFKRRQSSTYRESLGVCDLYTTVDSSIVRFKGQQILHITDNKGVETIFQIGSPVEALQKMAVKVYLAANRLNITLFFQWRPRSDPLMMIVDKGSRGPWLDFDDFSLDSETIKEVKSQGINLDGFASFHNKVVDRFISLGFQWTTAEQISLLRN